MVFTCSKGYVLTPSTKSATTQYNTFHITGNTRVHTTLKLTQLIKYNYYKHYNPTITTITILKTNYITNTTNTIITTIKTNAAAT